MPERYLVVDHLKLSYEGLLNPTELFNVISSWFFEKGWDWYEKLNREQITPAGKNIHIVLEPWKSVSDFYKIIMKIQLNMEELKEVEVQQNKEAVRLHHGQVHITFDAYVLVDRHEEWTKKPLWWFLTVLSQKFFFKSNFEKMEAWVTSDLDDLHQKIKNYLNVFKYTYQG